MLGAAVDERISISATVSNDGACNECVIHYEGTTDAAQPVPSSPGPGWDGQRSICDHRKKIVDEYTSRFTYAAPRVSVEQGAHIASEEDTAMHVVSVPIFPAHTNFNTKIRTGLLETDDDNAINLDFNVDTIFADRIYLKRWKDPEKADARHNEVKEVLEGAKCYSIEFSGRLCSDTAEGRCTTEKCNDLLEPEPTTEPVTSSLGVRCTCAIDTEARDQGPYDAKQVPSNGNCPFG